MLALHRVATKIMDEAYIESSKQTWFNLQRSGYNSHGWCDWDDYVERKGWYQVTNSDSLTPEEYASEIIKNCVEASTATDKMAGRRDKKEEEIFPSA